MPSVARIVDPLGLWPRAAAFGQRAAADATDAAVAAVEDVIVAAVRGGLVERVVDELLTSGALERVVADALDSEAGERIARRVADSPVIDAAIARVLASDELWVAIDEIARSPAVTEAISHQGAGFADQVAGEVGVRTRRADDRLEHAARRLLRRGPRPAPPGPEAP